MKKIIIIALMFLSVGIQAQSEDSINESFVRHYTHRHLATYTESEDAFVIDVEYNLSTNIFFNIDGTNNAKIVFSNEEIVMLYDVVVVDSEEDKEYAKFTCYTEEATFMQGAIGEGWLAVGADDYMLNFTNWSATNKENE